MTKIAIISDTHGDFREEWKELFKDCEYLLHCGDFASEIVYRQFRNAGFHMYMVRGNCDRGVWAENIPEYLSFRIAGKMFFMIHDGGRLPYLPPDTDFIVSGHTHMFHNFTQRGYVDINPGSASSPRGMDFAGAVILTIEDDGSYSVEHVHTN